MNNTDELVGTHTPDDFRNVWFQWIHQTDDEPTHEDYNINHLTIVEAQEKVRRSGHEMWIEIRKPPKPMNEAEARYLQEQTHDKKK